MLKHNLANSKFNVAFLFSGNADNMYAVMEFVYYAPTNIKIQCIISDREDCHGLSRARSSIIPFIVLEKEGYKTNEAYDLAIHHILMSNNIDLICLDKFNHKFSSKFINNWYNKIINAHSSLLPAFLDDNPIKQALISGVKITGCTIHFIRYGKNKGPIIIQAAAPIFSDDSEEMVTNRIIDIEQRCYPVAIKLIADNKISIKDEIVSIEY